MTGILLTLKWYSERQRFQHPAGFLSCNPMEENLLLPCMTAHSNNRLCSTLVQMWDFYIYSCECYSFWFYINSLHMISAFYCYLFFTMFFFSSPNRRQVCLERLCSSQMHRVQFIFYWLFTMSTFSFTGHAFFFFAVLWHIYCVNLQHSTFVFSMLWLCYSRWI